MTTPPEGDAPSPESKALFEAIAKGDEAQLRTLCEAHEGLLDSRDERGLSATMFALYNKQPDLAQVLVQEGAKLGIFDHCALGDLAEVQRALEQDAAQLQAHAPDGFSLLHLASFFGHAELVQQLLQRGADANAPAPGSQDITPLHAAAAGGSLSITAKLLDAGAEPNATQRGGFTALMSAAAQGNQPMAHALLRAGAEAHTKAEDGRSALDIARNAGHRKLAEFLLTKK